MRHLIQVKIEDGIRNTVLDQTDWGIRVKVTQKLLPVNTLRRIVIIREATYDETNT